MSGAEEPPEESMRGSAEEIGEMLSGYAMHEVDHLIVHLWPRTPEGVAELARAARITRSLGPA